MTWIIVGLGNPGVEYDHTRHNTGRMAVQSFANTCEDCGWKENTKANACVCKTSLRDIPIVLVLPNTFMNKSGNAIAPFVKSVRAAQQMIVVYDDLDMPLGSVKVSFDRGSGGHKGIESITRVLKTRAFVRIRVGVSPTTPTGKLKKPHGEDEVVDFILAPFKPKEQEILKQVFKKTDQILDTTITDGYVRAMNMYN